VGFVFHPLSPDTQARLRAADLAPDAVAALVRMAVEEDLAGGIDVTSTATVPAGQRSVGEYRSRAVGTVAGLPVAAATIEVVCGDAASDATFLVDDGARVHAGEVLLRVTAPTRLLLTAERTSLNLLCHLSGVATATARWADALAGTPTRVRDTRKTTPGLRALEKYAVRCGGGVNHRMSLSDAALVKDNHVLAAGGVAAAFAAVRHMDPTIALEIEVDSLEQLAEALEAGADTIMFDNFSVEEMREGVAATRAYEARTGRRVVLEASGGLTLDLARAVGATGVDYVAVGALTHSAPVPDIGLDLVSVS
jgi:nicotinate-nucleotide pyrophosphorylase (carboxylating)